MSKADLAAAVLLVGITLYAVFGGADFGAGFWALVAGRSERGRRARGLIQWAIGPVWEANHVWLIFVLVILWTAFSLAFSSIMSTLFIPLSLAALGVVLRGSGFAFNEVARRAGVRHFTEAVFGISAVLTPFFLGTVVGAIASGRVPVGNAQGDAVTSWLNPLSILIGVLFVASGAFLAAVFLVSDARRASEEDLERYFAQRALYAAVGVGVVAVAGVFALRSDARYVFDRLLDEGLPLVLLSAVCGATVIFLLLSGGRKWLRPLSVASVVAIIWSWGIAQFPFLLPEELTISEGAGTGETLTMVLIVFIAAILLVLPALGLLYSLDQRSMLEADLGDHSNTGSG